jgi:hypothetical protein
LVVGGHLVTSGSEGSERVTHRGACTFQEVCLVVHQASELAEALRGCPKRGCLSAERLRRLIDEFLRGAQGRDGAADKLALELELALEHPLE